MIDPEMRRAVFRLREAGLGVRRISRDLGLSRNTVRQIVQTRGQVPESARRDRIEIAPELLRQLYVECDGYRKRIHEKLTEEGVGPDQRTYQIAYPTLTRLLRRLQIGTARDARCDRVPDEPGAEMQHDTSPFAVRVGGKRRSAIASILYLRYSKRRYLRFYRSFGRFDMKCFLHEALSFWGYSAPCCIIDNTSLARLRGTGKGAVIAPEMEGFARRYSFRFQCHAIHHSNRKAGNECSFYTVQSNFLAGRCFESLEDLNRQALDWATQRVDRRPVGKGRVIPLEAFEQEKAALTRLGSHLPAPYQLLERTVDQYGYVAVSANYYWVPGQERGKVMVLLYSDHLVIYRHRQRLIEYRLPPDGTHNECFSPQGRPRPRHQPKNRKRPTAQEEKRLRALGGVVGEYLDFALREKGPQRRHRFVRELFALSQRVSAGRFTRAVERALKYRVTSVETLHNIVHLQLQEDSTLAAPGVEIDEAYREREAYLEGYLSDAPDFSAYDRILEDPDDG